MPSTKVLEAATIPLQPWRPLYWRDTAISVVGSLTLALLAMWLVELFNRPEPQPAVVLIQPQAGALRFEGMPQALADRSTPAASLQTGEPTLLPRQTRFPRELKQDEVTLLIRASDGETRLVTLLLLSGIDLDELLALRWSDIDFARGTMRVGGESGRDIALGDALRRTLEARAKPQESDPLVGSALRPTTRDSVDAQILCAAHDAALEEATQVNSACLRHTYLAFLVRQGVRFADLTRVVGPLAADVIGAYSALSPAGTRNRIAEIELLHPAVGNAMV